MKRLKCLVGPRARRASGRALALLVVLAMALAVAPMAVFADEETHFTDTLIKNAGEPIIDMSVATKGESTGDAKVDGYLGSGWRTEADGGGTWNDGLAKFTGGSLGDHSVNVLRYYMQTSSESTEDKNKPMNVLQFWAQKTSDSLAIRAIKDVESVSEENKKDYYVLEFYPSAGEDGGSYMTYGDIAFYDDEHKFITSFRYGMGDDASISPYWSFDGGGAKYGGELAPTSYELAGTDKDKQTVMNGFRIRRRKLVRVVVVNNKKDNTHSVQWYYKGGLDETVDKGDGSTISNTTNAGYLNRADEWTYFFGATYKNLVYGLGEIEAYRLSASGSWQHLGIGDLKVYGGNYAQEEEPFKIEEKFECQVGGSPALPSQVEIDGQTYVVSWEAVDTSGIGEKEATGTVVETGRKVKATVIVKKLEDFLKHYYKFDEQDGASTIADSKDTSASGMVKGSARIYKGKLLIADNAGDAEIAAVEISSPMLEQGQKQLTVSAWVYRTAYTENCPLFGFGSGAEKLGFFDLEAGAFQSKFEVRNSTVDKSEKKFGGQYNGFIDSSGWHHIALTVDSSDIATLYVNGIKIGTAAMDGYELANLIGNKNYIGWNGDSSYNTFDGYIDDFKVYNIAMMEEEVQAEAAKKPADCTELISFSEPTISSAEDGSLFIEYVIDFSDAKAAFTDVNADSDEYKVHVYSKDSDAGVVQNVSIDENGKATVGINPSNTNVPVYISAERDYKDTHKNNAASLLSNGNSKATTLYEELIKDLASGEYDVSSRLNPARLAAANAIIAKGGLTGLEVDPEVRGQIMEVQDTNKVVIKEPFKTLGIGFLYKDGEIYVGDNKATAAAANESDVYQSITIDSSNGTATLGDKFGAEPDEAETVTISLDEIDHVFVEGLMDIIDDAASGETEFVEEI